MAIRGGGMIEKSLFVQISAVSYLLFGVQLFGVPKMFWEMNFKAPEFTKSTEFLSRMFGMALIMLAALAKDANVDYAYKVFAIASPFVAYFGPFTAEKSFETAPAHKLPVILMPVLCALAILAY